MKNVSVRKNLNGTTSLSFSRTFRRQKLKLFMSQNPEATLEERFEQLRGITEYLDTMQELTESRTSMMDILMKHRYVTIEREVGRNAQLVLQMKATRRSWAFNQYGERKSIETCIATALTLMNVNSEANRVILGAVLRNRIVDLINQNRYKFKHRSQYRALPKVRSGLRMMNRAMKKDKYKFQQKLWISDQTVRVYAKLEYRYLLIKDGKTEHSYRSVLQKCLVLDNITVDEDEQRQGWFKSLINECMKFVYQLKYDALCIDNVINPDVQEFLDGNSVFDRQPENFNGKVDEFAPRYVRFRDISTTQVNHNVRRSEIKR